MFLEIYNSMGMLVKSFFVTDGTSISTEGLGSGMFHYILRDANGYQARGKFIVSGKNMQ